MQKYRVRINYKNLQGEDKQMERVAYGAAEAKELEAKLVAEIKEKPPEKRMTVQQLYDEYVEVKKHEVRESTLAKTRHILNNHVLPLLKDKSLPKLTLPELQNWKNLISKKEIVVTMKRNIYGEFRAMLNYAIKMGYLSSNPLIRLGNFKDAYEIRKTVDYYTADEFLKFISAAQKQSTEFYEKNYFVFFNIAFYTGLRKGEIHALKWSDIDGNILHVRRSISQKVKGGDRETPPKNKSSYRSLQIPEPLKGVLNEHYDRYKQVDGFTHDWRICGGETSLRDTTIELRNTLYAKLADVKKIRIHDFRHSHASLLANSGINIQEIARRLGHSKIEITWNTYSHLYPREEERAVAILDKIV
ncbi:site-specific integrase [Scatolibacter rhodanostii]|uniref:site-specific integrase n=1 Tax=Scatolibacter rhodanostii TaxID=2014781 RepID=UPI0013565FF2|nr:site-specific integrase [Scatolibacter rhodanostii]